MHDVLVRSANPGDVAFIVEMIRSLADYERLSSEVRATAGNLTKHLFGPRPYAEALIGEIDRERAGYALFFHRYSTFLTQPCVYVEDLFVARDRRGLGIGKALLGEVARLAVARGCARMEWAVLDWNESAIGFYCRIGARAVDGWTTYRLTGDALEHLAGNG